MTESGADRRERVGELGQLAETDPGALEDSVPELREYLGDGSASVRRRTARVAVALAETDPATAAPLVDALTDRLADDPAKADAAAALARVADGQPGAVVDDLPALVAALDDEGPVVVSAAEAIAALAGAEPDRLAQPGVLDRLFDLLGDEQTAPRRHAAVALAEIAAVAPEAVCAGSDALRAAVGDDDPAVARHAAVALGTAGTACPDAVVAAVPALVALLDRPDEGVRAGAAHALGHAFRTGDAGGSVGATVDALAGALDGESAVRQHATFALAVLAAEEPDAVRPAVDALARRLADESGAVRRNARAGLASLEEAYPAVVDAAVDDLVDRLVAVDGETASVAFTEAELRGLAGDDDAPEAQRAAADHALAFVESGAVSAATATSTPEVETTSTATADTDATSAEAGAAGASGGTSDDQSTDTADGEGTFFCPNCGESVESGAAFCPECGTEVE